MSSKAATTEQVLDRPSLEEMQDAVGRVLSSRYFANAPMKRRFLQLICEFHINGRGAELNEYLIGREVFGRNQSYNPATDPIVRVGAHGVREKLLLYYQMEGAGDRVRIEIPLGSYEPLFTRLPAASDPVPAAPAAEPASSSGPPDERQLHVLPPPLPRPASTDDLQRWRRRTWMLAAAALVLLAVIAALAAALMRMRTEQDGRLSETRAHAGLAWTPYLQTADPTLLVLSNPAVHRPMNTADPDALAREGIPLNEKQSALISSAAGNRLPLKAGQPMQLIPAFSTYTGIGEAIGVYRLSGLLHTLSEATVLKQSRSLTPDDLKNFDVVLLGSVYANQWSKPLTIRENFVYSPNSTILNLAPQPGEEREYRASFDPRTNALIEDHALITLVPSVHGDRTVMVLAGIYSEGTEAAAEFVTNLNHLAELDRRLRQIGRNGQPPRHFQALLKVRVENAFPTVTSLVALRALESTEP